MSPAGARDAYLVGFAKTDGYVSRHPTRGQMVRADDSQAGLTHGSVAIPLPDAKMRARGTTTEDRGRAAGGVTFAVLDATGKYGPDGDHPGRGLYFLPHRRRRYTVSYATPPSYRDVGPWPMTAQLSKPASVRNAGERRAARSDRGPDGSITRFRGEHASGR